MDKNKFYTKSKEINGTTYVAQFSGMSVAMRAVDETYINGTDTTSVVKMAEYILNNIIVEPNGLSIDDFEDAEELNEVISFGSDVMNGKFRNKKDESPAKGKSKE